MYYPYCFCPNYYAPPVHSYPTISASVTVSSLSVPKCGQINRSSEDFRVSVSGSYKITAPQGVSFTLYRNKTNWFDEKYGEYKNGDIVSLSAEDYFYYIGNPKMAFGNFEVTFTQMAGAM